MATMVGTMNLETHEVVRTHTSGAAGCAEVSVAKNVLLFFAAPFIGLAYIVAFPFVGTVMMARMALR